MLKCKNEPFEFEIVTKIMFIHFAAKSHKGLTQFGQRRCILEFGEAAGCIKSDIFTWVGELTA
jgi:hypothetical protein